MPDAKERSLPTSPSSPLPHYVSENDMDVTFDAEKYYVYGHKRIIVVIALSLILFISALDSTIVSVALPVIGAYFDDYSQASWVVTAYLISYTAFLPLISKLTDILGRRPILVFSTLFFLLWSGACGGAKSMIQLIIFRAMQGIGGSAIYSAVIITISTMVPRTEVAMYTPILGVVFALSSVAGPLVGGAITTHIHWGWIFFVNLPIGAVGAGLVFYGLKDPDPGPLSLRIVARRIDPIGSFLILSMSVLLAYALQVGGTTGYPWVSAKVLVPLLVSFGLIPFFIFIEIRRSEPLVPLHLFRQRNFVIIIIYTLSLGAGFFITTIFLPQRMEVVDMLSPIASGVRMLPQLLLLGAHSMLGGALVILTRSYRPLLTASAALGAVGCGLLSTLTAHTRFPAQYGFEALLGTSFGVTIPVSTMVVQFSTPRQFLVPAMGFQTFARQLGALVGIAMGTALLNSRVRSKLSAASGEAADGSFVNEIIQDPSGVLPKLSLTERAFVQSAYSDGFSNVFIVGTAWLALGTLVTLGVQHKWPADIGRLGRLGGQGGIDLEEMNAEAQEQRHTESTATGASLTPRQHVVGEGDQKSLGSQHQAPSSSDAVHTQT